MGRCIYLLLVENKVAHLIALADLLRMSLVSALTTGVHKMRWPAGELVDSLTSKIFEGMMTGSVLVQVSGAFPIDIVSARLR